MASLLVGIGVLLAQRLVERSRAQLVVDRRTSAVIAS